MQTAELTAKAPTSDSAVVLFQQLFKSATVYVPVCKASFELTNTPNTRQLPVISAQFSQGMNMPAATMTKTMDAVALLEADHRKVQKAFKDFEKLKGAGSKRDKSAIVSETCSDLTIHTTIEEEIFYPAVRRAIKDDDLMDEATVEHAGAKELIAQLESMQPGDDLYDAKFTVLGESVNHHIREEESEMFPKVRKSTLDLDALGHKMEERKEKLTNG